MNVFFRKERHKIKLKCMKIEKWIEEYLNKKSMEEENIMIYN